MNSLRHCYCVPSNSGSLAKLATIRRDDYRLSKMAIGWTVDAAISGFNLGRFKNSGTPQKVNLLAVGHRVGSRRSRLRPARARDPEVATQLERCVSLALPH